MDREIYGALRQSPSKTRYRALLRLKGEGESFSDVLMKLVKREGSGNGFLRGS
ncbi:MAG: hypothetical protein D6733_06475 [Methanobacteriota archaeon]|nr:MAG: hypothetical protein D6733_06475 [Euryarchaeota archaeon]